MHLLSGEVRRVIDKPYSNKSGKQIDQAILVLEPDDSAQNFEIFLSAKQLASGARQNWEKLKGKKAAVMVSLFVNHEYKFYKYNAIGEALPIMQPELEAFS